MKVSTIAIAGMESYKYTIMRVFVGLVRYFLRKPFASWCLCGLKKVATKAQGHEGITLVTLCSSHVRTRLLLYVGARVDSRAMRLRVVTQTFLCSMSY